MYLLGIPNQASFCGWTDKCANAPLSFAYGWQMVAGPADLPAALAALCQLLPRGDGAYSVHHVLSSLSADFRGKVAITCRDC